MSSKMIYNETLIPKVVSYAVVHGYQILQKQIRIKKRLAQAVLNTFLSWELILFFYPMSIRPHRTPIAQVFNSLEGSQGDRTLSSV